MRKLFCSFVFLFCVVGLSIAQLKVQRLDCIIKKKDSLHLNTKFVVSNFQKSNESFVFNSNSVLKDVTIKDVPVNSVNYRGQKIINNKTYNFDWVMDEDCYSLHVSYLGNDIPIFSYCQKQFEHINSSVVIWDEIITKSKEPYVIMNISNTYDTFPFYYNEELASVYINIDSIFRQFENDFSSIKNLFNLETKIVVAQNLNDFEIAVSSELFALEKDKLMLEITSLNGKVYYSDGINFNQKYSILIPPEEKLIVYKVSYDGIIIESKKIVR